VAVHLEHILLHYNDLMRRVLKLFTPPVVFVLARKALSCIARNQIANDNVSYENPKLVDSVIEKTVLAKKNIEENQRINIDSFRILVAFALGKSDINSIVDLGGAAGYHYFTAKTTFPNMQLNWTVVETRMLVHAAQNKSELNEITFCTNIQEAFTSLSNNVDLVYSSRAFQYLEDPIASLKEITALKPRYIFLTGIAFSPDDDVHEIIQVSELRDNGPQFSNGKVRNAEVMYKLRLYPRSVIENILNPEYNIQLRIDEDPIVHTYKGRPVSYNGIWAARKPIQ
jgi:putative methyltransferase (TIGR04325 family)